MASLKTEFKQFSKNSYLKLNYNKIYSDLKKILKRSANKDKDIKEFAYRMTEEIVGQNISFKTRIPDEKEFARRETVCPSSIHASMSALGFIQRMCVEIDPTHKFKDELGLKDEEISSIINKTVDKTVKYDSISDYMKKEPYEALLSEVNEVSNSVEENTTYHKLSSVKDKERLQDIYMKKEMAKTEMAKHTKLWKFIFSSKVKAYNEFISKSESLLEKYSFDTAAIQDAVNTYAKVNDQYDDKGFTKEFFAEKKAQLELAKKANGKATTNTVNELRFVNARKEEDKTHALENKMEKITSKYPGMDASCSSIGMLKEKCRDYDNTKDKTIFKEATKLIYWGFFTEMVDRQGADNLNIKEVMHDANKLTLLVMNRYTPVYEDPELADILPELSFGTMNADGIMRATKKGLGVEVDIKDEAQKVIDEYKQNDNVKLDKEALGIKIESIVVNEVLDENIHIVDEVKENKEAAKVNVIN